MKTKPAHSLVDLPFIGHPSVGLPLAGLGRFLSVATILVASATCLPTVLTALTWVGNGDATTPGSGNWNVASNWEENTAPVVGTSGNARTYVFGGSGDTPYISTQNAGGALTGVDTGKMIFQYLYLQSTATVTETIAGGNLVFSYSSPTIYQNGTGDFNITSNYVFAGATTFAGTGSGTLTFSGIAGGNGTTVSGGNITINTNNSAATLRFAGNNNLLANITLTNGTLDFTAAGALNSYGATNLTINGGTFLSSVGSTAANGGGTSGGSRTMQINGAFTLGGAQNWGTGTMAVKLNDNVAITVNTGGASGVTLGGVISDGTSGNTLTLAAGSTGTLTLAAQNTYTGDTIVNGGTLVLGISEAITDTSGLVLGGGTLAAGAFAETLGTLSLTANSAITLDESGGGSLTFANSAANNWSTFTLSITGTVAANSIRFGTDGTGLTSAQLAAITLNGSVAILDANGYLLTVAVPEPAATTALLGAGVLLAGSLLVRRRCHRNAS
ncbi:MAG: PEP-CTERM sorting domain-containing protein [Opitutaceae bacterium]|nr:PEP-CTERM sorting domain-containing protein [Opitutaceae bacterium]